MLMNTLIHAALGVIGRNVFVWSWEGAALAVGSAALIQAIDMVRLYRYHNTRFLASPAGESDEEIQRFRRGLKVKLPQIYLMKVVWYTIITVAVAAIARVVG